MNRRRRFQVKARRRQRRTNPIFVNVYSVGRNYGGPEEGGWYFDSGDALRSVEVHSDEAAQRVRDRLTATYNGAQPRHDRFSVIGGPDIEVWLEEQPAQDYPSHRPHYE